ncbi:hypothetical protein COX08_02220 [Candidatus Beckwithbacteria bacterium CG23_combo_of_CG06-09_8_20_14_all_34_8]|uniref:Anti-sigma factor n=1 Tax=Candidatus Beckwithbacteria bacterium CG23_combo_of_CG06-09_8_20_14_all_34_8 TaxID=1974497 RepID=A0A2H0B6G7_9BACT|nr:MAG: hypothetical protein COX08_02220 [Candidatus Beckwithbacteria bacterium CG23_combo_of_CG06-09_8_20_14_all_34_8]
MKQWMIIGIIALVLIGAYVWNRNKNVQPIGEQVPPVEEIITQEDGTVVKRVGDMTEELSQTEMQAKKQETDDKTKDVEAVILNPELGLKGSGSSKSVFTDGTYYQKITVNNLSALEKGYYYQAWLQKSDGSTISIGRVEMTTANSGQLYYQAKEDRIGAKVIISKQMEGQKEMGEIILK